MQQSLTTGAAYGSSAVTVGIRSDQIVQTKTNHARHKTISDNEQTSLIVIPLRQSIFERNPADQQRRAISDKKNRSPPTKTPCSRPEQLRLFPRNDLNSLHHFYFKDGIYTISRSTAA